MNLKHIKVSVILVSVLYMTSFLLGCDTEKPLSPPLSPEESLATFQLADDNLKIELVASEPLVQDPVAITFDEAGRLWVAEMLGFMQDIDGTGEEDKIGRISVLFDDDGDGKMDRRQTFLDSLVLPRALAIVKGGALVAENMPLWFASDHDGDLIADNKILIDSLYGGLGVPEHSANGLLRGMDNWFYNAKSKYRYKKIGDEWVQDETEFRGQWGIAQDDAGRLFYNYNWSQLHADLVPPNSLMANKNYTSTTGIDHGLTLDRKVYPIRSNTAINRGYVPGTLDENGRILEFASACGPLVYRGTAMPENYRGDAFVCEPTANLIKQNKIIEEGFMLRAENAYENKEFLASTDERFRPISLTSGPDGAMYVVDMYKGVIQHAPYMTEYLREETLRRGLDKPINMGRIWRISSKDKMYSLAPDFSKMDASELIEQLESKNGWTRDTAQRLLVEKADLSIVPNLENLVSNGNALGQLHALWTLEGLGNDNTDIYISALKATDPKVVQAALRLATASVSTHPEIVSKMEDLIIADFDESESSVKMQMVLASSRIDSKIAFDVSERFLDDYGQLPVTRDIIMSSLEGREFGMVTKLLSESKTKVYNQNLEILLEMLATVVSKYKFKKYDRRLEYLANNISDPNQLWVKNALLNGLKNEVVTHETEATTNVNINQKKYTVGRQKYINICASCHGTGGEGMKRFAPPLKQSEWVNGDEKKLAMLLLHGMQGPVEVNGKKYDSPDILPEMPSFSTLQNEDIAAIATYIRNAWGNSAEEVTSRTVGSIRFRTQGKVIPWTATELDTLVYSLDQ